MGNPLQKNRHAAFVRQGGLCYYCGQPMWERNAKSHALRLNITKLQAQDLRCTAEHRVARQDGGGNRASNIVAAHRKCNADRHKVSKYAPSAEEFRALMRGSWSSRR